MPDPENLDRARRAVASVGISADALAAILSETYGEGYVTGTHAAMGALPASVEAIGPTWETDIDWDTWEPGSARTAVELAGTDGGRGLATLLDDADVVIQGINDYTVEVLAQQLAAGVEAGESVAQLTARLRDTLGSSARAEMIARTEVARAQTVATLDTYRENGMGGRQWLAASGAEEDCAALDGTVVAMDADFPDGDPPLHPNCRCALIPVLASEMP